MPRLAKRLLPTARRPRRYECTEVFADVEQILVLRLRVYPLLPQLGGDGGIVGGIGDHGSPGLDGVKGLLGA